MISPSILDLDGRFENMKNMVFSVRDIVLLGLILEREDNKLMKRLQ